MLTMSIVNTKKINLFNFLWTLIFFMSSFSSATVIYTDDAREYYYEGYDDSESIYQVPVIPFADFNVPCDWLGCPHKSSMTKDGFKFDAGIRAGQDVSQKKTWSIFDVTFVVDSNTYLEIDSGFYCQYDRSTRCFGRVGLYEGNSLYNPIFFQQEDTGFYFDYDFREPFNVEEVLFLVPGEYRLVIAAEVWAYVGGSIVSASGVFWPAEVPVPAAAWLMVSSLLGLVGLNRRKK